MTLRLPKLSFMLVVFGIFVSALSIEGASQDLAAFAKLEELMGQSNATGETATAEELEDRRRASAELVKSARRFLGEYPNSKKIEHATGLIAIGLFNGALAGDKDSASALREYARSAPTNKALSSDLKTRACALKYMADWGIKNGKTDVNEAKAEGRKVWLEGLFEAADILEEREDIFKTLLLQARSGFAMTADEKRALAVRIEKYPGASDWVKTQARDIASGKLPYEIGKPVTIKFTAIDGRKVDIENFKGKVVLVDFWATWCGPCVAAMPALKAVYEKHHDSGLEIVGISLDEERRDLVNYLKTHEIRWPQFFDGKGWNNEVSFPFGINAVPDLWIIDKKGVLRDTKIHADENALRETFRSLMAEAE